MSQTDGLSIGKHTHSDQHPTQTRHAGTGLQSARTLPAHTGAPQVQVLRAVLLCLGLGFAGLHPASSRAQTQVEQTQPAPAGNTVAGAVNPGAVDAASLPVGIAPASSALAFPLIERPEGVRMAGMYAQRTLPFRVSERWLLTGPGQLQLPVVGSDLLIGSSLTLKVNGSELTSVALKPGETLLTLPLPERLLVPGWNVLELSTYLRSTPDACLDRDNPGLWVKLLPEARVSLPHILSPAPVTLEGFPQSLTIPDVPGTSPTVTFLIPESSSPGILEAAALLAARLGQTRELRPGALRAFWADMPGQADPSLLVGSHVIFVGTSEGLGALNRWGVPTDALGAALNNSEYAGGVLMALPHPSSLQRQVVVALADNAGAEAVLSGLLRSKEGLKRLSGTVRSLREQAVWNDPPLGDDRIRTLLASEAPAPVLRGLTASSLHVPVAVPRHFFLTREARLELAFTWDLPMRRGGTLEVALGNRPLKSIELGGLANPSGTRSGQSEVVEIPLPADAAFSGQLDFQLRLFLDARDESCTGTLDESAWVRIERESRVHLPHVSRPLSLGLYPDLLALGAGLERASVLLGRGTGPGALTAFLATASGLGAAVPNANRLELEGRRLSSLLEADVREQSSRARIAIMGPLEQGVKTWLRDVPLLEKDPDGTLWRIEASIAGRAPVKIPDTLGSEDATRLKEAALLQLVRRPASPDSPLLLVSSESDEALKIASRTLAQFWYDGALESEAALVPVRGAAVLLPLHPLEASGDLPGAIGPASSTLLVVSLLGLALALIFYWRLGQRS